MFRKRFLGKRPALFKSGQWHSYQNNAPVHNSILFTDYLNNMGIKTVPHPSYSSDLAPLTFGYLLSSEAVVMRQLRRWKRLRRKSLTRSHKTSMGPSRSCWNAKTSALELEEITSKETSFMCELSIKVPIRKKKSGNLFSDPRIFSKKKSKYRSIGNLSLLKYKSDSVLYFLLLFYRVHVTLIILPYVVLPDCESLWIFVAKHVFYFCIFLQLSFPVPSLT